MNCAAPLRAVEGAIHRRALCCRLRFLSKASVIDVLLVQKDNALPMWSGQVQRYPLVCDFAKTPVKPSLHLQAGPGSPLTLGPLQCAGSQVPTGVDPIYEMVPTLAMLRK